MSRKKTHPTVGYAITFWPGTQSLQGESKYFLCEGLMDLKKAVELEADPVDSLLEQLRPVMQNAIDAMVKQGDIKLGKREATVIDLKAVKTANEKLN